MEKEICFIVGAPRSGTTWLNNMLIQNREICGGAESYFFSMFGEFKEARRLHDSPRPVGPYCYFDEKEFARKIRLFWMEFFRELYEANPDCSVHLEKTPYHAHFLEEISLVFPTSKVIFLKRDSRSVVSSMLAANRSWGAHWAPGSPKQASIMWHQHVRAVRTWRLAHPQHPYLEVKYEDLVTQDSLEFEKILLFILGAKGEGARQDHVSANNSMLPAEPPGFARIRGSSGWTEDMNPVQKLVTWRYTRKLMREIGYDIKPFA